MRTRNIPQLAITKMVAYNVIPCGCCFEGCVACDLVAEEGGDDEAGCTYVRLRRVRGKHPRRSQRSQMVMADRIACVKW